MSKFLNTCFLLSVAGSLFLAQPSSAAEAVNGNLVSVKWLEKNLNDPNVVILDASATQTYAAKHIPRAVSVDLYTWYGVHEVPVASMEKLFQSWGVSPGKKIVVYDQGASFLATRLFYSLYYFGYPEKDLFVLDGGLSKWQAEGLEVTKDVTPVATKGSFTIKKINEDVRVRLPEVLTGSGEPDKTVLVEALGADWHFGQVVAFNKPGHIPNGVLLPSADLYNPDKTFKSPEEIKKMLDYLGIKPDQQIYTYCGGGVAASAPFFALKFMANYPKVKLYTESEMGWLSDERDLPYWTYDAPFLMREAKWLQFWGGPMIRTFGGADVSIVDVRPADAFNQGHIPFAINLSAEQFKSRIGSPERLAADLGQAGVNATHEAVVISGGGITKESALAFVMLEKLGQKKVSIFMDSMDKWTQLGLAVKKEPTALPATTYPANIRKDVVVADPQSTRGTFPKVFIASGKDVPAAAHDGTVVHVPYTDLLTADGTPKPAKDIWNILTKAGVPRYAELVCFSDDPGEAAVNYFVLKLMGYPDIKVLAP
jgi:thiosulfate/3-mercaptopyruvate sulfurtransferase